MSKVHFSIAFINSLTTLPPSLGLDALCKIKSNQIKNVGGGLRGATAVEWRRRQRVEKHGGRWAVVE